jgi:hypothetical protein
MDRATVDEHTIDVVVVAVLDEQRVTVAAGQHVDGQH